MKLEGKLIMKAALALGAIALLLYSCSGFNRWVNLDDDNPIEEIGEQVIEQYTGLDLDLTPETPER